MIPRSKQPSEFDAFHDPDGELETSQASDAAWEDALLLRVLAEPEEAPGSGAGEWVTKPGGRRTPSDFSAEELALARTLNHLFAVEREELPPLFIQTLTGDAQHATAPGGLIQRVTAHTFGRLRLPHRLPHEEGEQTRLRGFRGSKRLPRAVGLSTVLALLLLSVLAVAPAFANGLRLLLPNTGVQIASGYPGQAMTDLVLTQYLSLPQVQKSVPFQTYWLGKAKADYHYDAFLLHMGQQWADGPVVEVQYRLSQSSGTGLLSVREFRPVAGNTVLLVVAPGAAQFVQVNGQQAIYINGRWVQHHGVLTWEPGTQVELLYQTAGLVFWITADQRDGATSTSLEMMAASLEQLYLEMPPANVPEVPMPPHAQIAPALAGASLGEVVTLLPTGASSNPGSQVYVALGQPPDTGM